MSEIPPTAIWYCDSCGEPITRPEDGWVEWLTRKVADKYECYGIRLVHHAPASRALGLKRCQYDGSAVFRRERATIGDVGLSQFLGPDGLVELLELLVMGQSGPFDKHKLTELILRLHTPGYEAARQHLREAIEDGVIQPDRGKGFEIFLCQGEITAILKEYEK